MNQFWENVVTDGQKDRQTDGRTDGQEWFNRTISTNVERPIAVYSTRFFVNQVLMENHFNIVLND